MFWHARLPPLGANQIKITAAKYWKQQDIQDVSCPILPHFWVVMVTGISPMGSLKGSGIRNSDCFTVSNINLPKSRGPMILLHRYWLGKLLPRWPTIGYNLLDSVLILFLVGMECFHSIHWAMFKPIGQLQGVRRVLVELWSLELHVKNADLDRNKLWYPPEYL